MDPGLITRKELTRLAALRSDEGILSAYLAIEPRLMHEPGHPVAMFKGAYKWFVRRNRSDRWLAAAEREKPRVLRHLEGWRPTGRGLVLFCGEPAGVWEVLSLNVTVPTLVDVDATTHTAVLTRILDEYPRFVVATVQKDRARIYTAEQGTAEHLESIRSDVPGRHDQGGWSQARFQRHIEFLASEHLRKVADELERLYHDRPYDRLAIGGSRESANELLKMLPTAVAARCIGTFAADLKHDSESEVLDTARGLSEAHERRTEQALVTRVIDAARSDGHGVLGVRRTIEATREGRVHTLVVANGVRHRGYVCVGCDYFDADSFPRCPACGCESEEIPDVVERAVERAYLTGADVNTVFEDARVALMVENGLGALLRY